MADSICRQPVAYARAIEPLGLRWYEEIGDPLDFALNRQMTELYAGRWPPGKICFPCRM